MLIGVFAAGVLGYKIIGWHEWSLLKCAYMTVITLTTVGYEDVLGVGKNTAATIFTMCLIIAGMGVVLYCVSTITAFFVEGGMKQIFKEHKMTDKISHLNGHVIIAGVGGTGEYCVEEIHRSGMPFVVIETKLESIQKLSEKFGEILYIHGDATEDDNLMKAGIDRAMGVVACLSNDKDNLYLTVTARTLNQSLKIVARGIAPEIREKLTRIGANYVVSPNMIGGLRMASEMIRPTVVSFLDRMLRAKDESVRVGEITVQPGSYIDGKTIGESDIYEKTGLLVMAVLDVRSSEFEYNPAGSYKLEGGDVIIVVGEISSIEKLKKLAEQ